MATMHIYPMKEGAKAAVRKLFRGAAEKDGVFTVGAGFRDAVDALGKELGDGDVVPVWIDGSDGLDFHFVSNGGTSKVPFRDVLEVAAKNGARGDAEDGGVECLNEFAFFMPTTSKARKQMEKRVRQMAEDGSEGILCRPCKGGVFISTQAPVLSDAVDVLFWHVSATMKSCGLKGDVVAEVRKTFMGMDGDETAFEGRVANAEGCVRMSPQAALRAAG